MRLSAIITLLFIPTLVFSQTKEETEEWLNVHGNEIFMGEGIIEREGSLGWAGGYHRIYDDPIKLNFRNDSLIFLQNHQVSIRQGKYRYISSKIKKVYSLKISDLISVSSVGINNTKLDLVSSKDKIKYYRWEKEEVSAPIDNYYEDPKITTNNKFLSKLSFTFDVVSVNDLNRIVKAITHLAELSGAKLEKIVDKDTF